MITEDALYPLLKVYMRSPQWVKSTLGKGYSLVPKHIKYGSGYTSFANELTISDAAGIKSLAEKKLAHTLEWAIKTVPAYWSYKYLLQLDLSPEDMLLRLPLASKEKIKAKPQQYLSTQVEEDERLKMFTGGSTAQPMQFYLQKNISRPKEYAFMDNFHARVGLDSDAVILALRGRTVPTASDKTNMKLWMFEPIKRHLILSSDHLESRYMPLYVEALRAIKPTYIQAFPSALYPLAKWLNENQIDDVTQNIKGILLFSENLYDYQMRLFSKTFHCPVLKHYGHSERVVMAASMPDDERYFFWPQYGKFELIDFDGGLITQPGILGEIVGTSFDNQVMPFIRYRTGDLAMLSDKPGHPDLPNYPACERIEGRLQEFVVCKDKRLVSITTLGAAHFDQLAGVEAIQYEQHEAGKIILNIVSSSDLSSEASAAIAHAVKYKTQGGCEVNVVRVAQIERTARGKHKMLIQHLNLSSYSAASAIE